VDKADLIIELDRRFRLMESGVGEMAVTIQSRERLRSIVISRSEWARCRSRFDRWDLIRSRL
jgi:hypothetical protein